MKEKLPNAALLAMIILFILLGASVYYLAKQAGENVPKIKVATTIFPIYDITQNIAGDKMRVVQLIPNGSSPHTFEATVKQQQEVNDSELILTIGGNIDNWIYDLSDDDSRIKSLENRIDFREQANGELDYHYWLSITNSMIVAENIYQELSDIDADNKDYYRQNLENYLIELDEARFDALTIALNMETKVIITQHRAFDYWLEELAVKSPAVLQAIPGGEVDQRKIDRINTIIENNQLEFVYIEKQLEDTLSEDVLEQINAEIKYLDPLGGEGENDTFLKTLRFNIEALADQ